MSNDILDYIDDENSDDEFDEVLEDLEEEAEAGTELEMAMSESRARELTEAIRAAATVTFVLLAQAHEKQAHKALGYATWADYVKEEFDMTAQRSYQLLDLSRVTNEIEAAVPEGTEIKITEAQARDIKRELPMVTEKIKAAVGEGEDPNEAVDRIIDETREQKKADDKAIADKQKALETAEEDGYRAGLEAAADALLEQDEQEKEVDENLIAVDEVEQVGNALSPEDSMNLYNFFNVLNGIASLPEPDDFIQVIPKDRGSEITQSLPEVQVWINRFVALWDVEQEESHEEEDDVFDS